MGIVIVSFLFLTVAPDSPGGSARTASNAQQLQWTDAAAVAHRITSMAVLPATDGTPTRVLHGDRFGYLRASQFQDGLLQEIWRSKKLEGAIFEVRVDDLRGHGTPYISVWTFDGHVYVYDYELALVWESLHLEYDAIHAFGVGNVDHDQALELVVLADEGRIDYIDGSTFFREFQSIQLYAGTDLAIGNVDTDPELEIVLNSGIVIDVDTGEAEWTTSSFGLSIELLDIDGDGIDEVLGHALDEPMRIYSVENQEEEPVR